MKLRRFRVIHLFLNIMEDLNSGLRNSYDFVEDLFSYSISLWDLIRRPYERQGRVQTAMLCRSPLVDKSVFNCIKFLIPLSLFCYLKKFHTVEHNYLSKNKGNPSFLFYAYAQILMSHARLLIKNCRMDSVFLMMKRFIKSQITQHIKYSLLIRVIQGYMTASILRALVK